MKFEISRTSVSPWRCDEKPPCPGATLETGPGGRHWVIEIASLEDLVGLAKASGNQGLIISCEKDPLSATDLPELEIYDDWRE